MAPPAGKAADTRPVGAKLKEAAVSSASSLPATSVDHDAIVTGRWLSELATIGASAGPRSKLAAILTTAVEQFGLSGYETTKWSAVAEEVGIGQPALYHYFESKAHCLLTIMRLELARSLLRFRQATLATSSDSAAYQAALRAAFEVTPAEVSQLRILVVSGDILASARAADREENERLICLELTHQIEREWTALLGRLVSARRDDRRDPHTLALAVLGLLNSVWRWYRLGGKLSLTEVGELYCDAAERILGLT